MKKILFVFMTVCLSWVLASCIKDDSSESDGSVNITISGIEERYDVVSFTDDKLVITPVVSSTTGESDLEYAWYYYDDLKSIDNTKENSAILFNNEKDINSGLSFGDGRFVFFLVVTSKSTGYKKYAKTTVYTACDLSKGFVAFKENADGNTDYDLFNTNNNSLITDVLANVNGETVPGKPRAGDVCYYFAYQDPETDECRFGNCVCITTENNEVRWIRCSDAVTVMDADNAHFEKMEGEIPYRTVRGYFETYFLSSNGVWGNYAGSVAMAGILGTFSGNGGSTHCVTTPAAYYCLVYWDEQTRSIAYSDFNNGYSATIDAFPGFTATNTNYDCITCGLNTTAGEKIYFLLQDRSTGKKYMFYIDCSMWVPMLVNVEEVDSSSHLANGNAFAACQTQATLAYVAHNNKLYAYDLGGTQTEREISIPGLPTGENITYLSNRTYPGADGFNYLIIGTQSGDTYHVYMYNMIAGEPVGTPQLTFSGTGRLHSIDYVNPAAPDMSCAYYMVYDK